MGGMRGGEGGAVMVSPSGLSDSLWPHELAPQAPLSLGFPRQEYWSGLPFHSPGNLPDPGIEPRSPVLQMVSCIAGGFFTNWATRERRHTHIHTHTHTHTHTNSVQVNCSVVSDSLQPHGLQHARLPCPSLTPEACSNSCPLSPWCHPTISSLVVAFSSCLQSFPALGSFPMSQFFVSGGQSIGKYWPKYFSFSISPSHEYSGLISFRVDWLNLLAIQGSLKSFLLHHSSKASILWHSAFFMSNSHIHTWLLEKQQFWLDRYLLAK